MVGRQAAMQTEEESSDQDTARQQQTSHEEEVVLPGYAAQNYKQSGSVWPGRRWSGGAGPTDS